MAGSWQPLANQPKFNAATMLLLTDGTVMCQALDHTYGGKDWWQLSPTNTGDYVHGTWTKLTSMIHARAFFASAVLSDGRVFVAGGEYSDKGNEYTGVEIYEPYKKVWKSVADPGWKSVGDAPSCVLPDGRVLLGSRDGKQTAIFDPNTETWTAGGSKDDTSSEETWTLLPDGTVLTVECNNPPNAEKYVPSLNAWVSAGATPGSIIEVTPTLTEIGPALLLPDGRVFCIGGNGNTALYTPPAVATQPGTWAQGPDFPSKPQGQLISNDAAGCLLPNGKVLCVAGVADKNIGWATPTYFFEYDPNAGTLTEVLPRPKNATDDVFKGSMLLLPTGQVLFSAWTKHIEVYTPNGGPNAAWKPTITAAPTSIYRGQTSSISGTQLNGLSQAVSYGDDEQMATNYPLVRLTNVATHQVRYCKTFGHSTMGVATGNTVHSTTFAVPLDADLGAADLCVVANGISSDPVQVGVQRMAPFTAHVEAWQQLIGSLADGPLWALTPHGPVPVDPQNAALAQRARKAHTALNKALSELEHIGAEVSQLRVPTPFEALPDKSEETDRRRAPSGGKRQKQVAAVRAGKPDEPPSPADLEQ